MIIHGYHKLCSTPDSANGTVEDKWCWFQDMAHDTMDKFVPHKVTSSRYNVPWFNKTHRRLCRKKQRLYNIARLLNDEVTGMPTTGLGNKCNENSVQQDSTTLRITEKLLSRTTQRSFGTISRTSIRKTTG